jgi:ADP-ribosylglycohydrolase
VSGTTVVLPAGTYSDDTQLRLAVCRSILGDGTFDVETFAKIELTVWPNYALGAGRGTKAAATNLAKRDVNWFSNFFDGGAGRTYLNAGGNGAAMRVQPHVWRKSPTKHQDYLTDVVKDSLITHGHMRGICGAVFHADCLAYVLENNSIPGPTQWREFISNFSEIPAVIHANYQLERFWLAEWERIGGRSLNSAISEVIAEMSRYVEMFGEEGRLFDTSYDSIVETLGGFKEFQGTGTTTALAAAFLSWATQDRPIEESILEAANLLGSDTDTIGTMVGALRGAMADEEPSWQIQDREYIVEQALRLVAISEGHVQKSFKYPDVIEWQPPATQGDCVGLVDGRLALAGLGYLNDPGAEWSVGEYSWKWFKLDFGQTVLCKMRNTQEIPLTRGQIAHVSERKETLSVGAKDLSRNEEPVPAVNISAMQQASGKSENSRDLFDDEFANNQFNPSRIRTQNNSSPSQVPGKKGLDELTDTVIRSNFDSKVLGDCFYECASEHDGIERSVAFAAIIAKAMVSRRKRKR